MRSRASIIVNAADHSTAIGQCVLALLRSNPLPECLQIEVIIVSPPIPKDATIIPPSVANALRARNWLVTLHCMTEGSVTDALNQGDALATGDTVVYLDGRVHVSQTLIPSLLNILETDQPRYAGARATGAIEQAVFETWHNRFLSSMPVFSLHAECGVFAVNSAGRALWGKFPDLILPDEYAKLHFSRSDRKLVQAPFAVFRKTGFSELVRERRRRSLGIKQLELKHRELMKHDKCPALNRRAVLARATSDPLGFGAYLAVVLTEKSPLYRTRSRWFRRKNNADKMTVGEFRKRFGTWPFPIRFRKRPFAERSGPGRL